MPDSLDERAERLNMKHRAVSLLTKTEMGKKIVSDQRYRMILSAAAAFMFHLLYALYHCILGIVNRSLLFISLCAFYGILAVTRFSAVLCERNHHELPFDDTEIFVMKFSGILLALLSFVLAAVNYISLSQNIASRHEKITMITIAAYTFYKIAMAVVKAIKRPKNPSLLLSVLRNISYAEVAASVLTLQRSMLVSFGATNAKQVRFMNAVTGAAVCLFVLMLGLSMITKSKKERNLNNGKI